jgi:hypothetical protein
MNVTRQEKAASQLGHTASSSFTEQELRHIEMKVAEQREYDRKNHEQVMREIAADERKALDALQSVRLRREIVLRLHAHLLSDELVKEQP